MKISQMIQKLSVRTDAQFCYLTPLLVVRNGLNAVSHFCHSNVDRQSKHKVRTFVVLSQTSR